MGNRVNIIIFLKNDVRAVRKDSSPCPPWNRGARQHTTHPCADVHAVRFSKTPFFYMELAVEPKPRQGATDIGFEFFPCDMELG